MTAIEVTDRDKVLERLNSLGIKVIDTDTHFSEPHDLWTSRVPATYRDLVPHVIRDHDGVEAWVVNGEEILSKPAGAASSVNRDNIKRHFWDMDIRDGLGFDEVSAAAYDPRARVELMDAQCIHAQIMYPNVAGFGAHKLMELDRDLSLTIVRVYNDAMAEFQSASGNRVFPQALIPFWDVDAAVREAERAATELELRGITMCSEPHAGGLPDIVDPHWYPLWEACTSLALPVNFHIGASEFGMDAFLKGVWPSLDDRRKHVVGAVQIEMHNGKVMANLLASSLLPRFPDLKVVSVESGIGWVPYVFERMEYQLLDASESGEGIDQPSPRDLFHRQVYICFWFEDIAPRKLLDYIGFDNVMFETDFPHNTCLYPNGVAHALDVLEPWGPEVMKKVLESNAANLYRIPV